MCLSGKGARPNQQQAMTNQANNQTAMTQTAARNLLGISQSHDPQKAAEIAARMGASLVTGVPLRYRVAVKTLVAAA